MSVRRGPGRPAAINVDQLVVAALSEGLDSFTMTSIGARLGVAHSGLYRYVHDRDALVVEALGWVARQATWPSPEGGWRDVLAGIGDTLWVICDSYPGYAAAAISTRQISSGFAEMLTPYVDSMRSQGMPVVDATAAIDFVRTLVLNSSIDAARLRAAEGNPHAIEHSIPGYADPEKWTGRSWYQRQLSTYLDGLALRTV